MLLALALLGLAVPVEDSVFGCAVLSVEDLDADGVREIAVADKAWVRDGRRQWAVWIVSGSTHARLAFHREDHGEGAQNLRLDSIGDVDRDGVRDLVVYEGGGTIHILSGRSLVELHETKRTTGECGAADVAWLECGEQSGLVVGCPREGSGQARFLPLGERKFESERLLIPGDSGYLHLGAMLLAIPGKQGECSDLLVGMSDDLQSISCIGVFSLEPSKGMKGIDLLPHVPIGPAALVGDVDRDGVRDIAIATRASGRRWVSIISGTTHKTVRTIGNPGPPDTFAGDDGAFGEAICGLDDCDGDGVQDLAVSAPEARMYNGAVLIISGRTGEKIREVLGDPADVHLGCALSLADDVDHDGCRDILVGMGWAGWMRSRSGVYTLSGRTGAILGTLLRKDLE